MAATLFLALVAAPCSAEGSLRLVRAFDGDSFVLAKGNHRVEIRLLNVDCPEYRQEYWKKARAFTTAFLLRGALRLELSEESTDRYGRTLAWVWSGKDMLNVELVRAGLALPVYLKRHPKYAGVLGQALEQARREKAGFWASGGLRQTPSRFRKSRAGN